MLLALVHAILILSHSRWQNRIAVHAFELKSHVNPSVSNQGFGENSLHRIRHSPRARRSCSQRTVN